MFLVVVAVSGLMSSAQAATNDFIADGNITVNDLSVGSQGAVVDLFIFSGAEAESWSVASGVFTVTNPGTSFTVGSSDAGAASFKVTLSGAQVACTDNATPGTTYVTVPTDTGVYTITPQESLCAASASVILLGGGGGGGSSAPTTYQTYTPDVDTTAQTTTPPADTTPTTGDTNIVNVRADALTIFSGTKAEIAAKAGKAIDSAKEAEYDTSIVSRVVASEASVSSAVRERVVAFVTYGSPTTDALGAGERGGVVNSFKEAFGKLPESNDDWEDVVKIANGRWPGQTSATREETAEGNFRAIYLRAPDRSNPNDDAAVVVMAYGLRSRNRKLESEKAAIKIYEDIFNRMPVSATSWDAVRAIAYSGATR